MDKEAKFYHVYCNLPLPIREEIIIVIDKEPISWKVAKLEVDNHTKIGQEILQKLVELDFI